MVFYFTCSDPRYTIYMGRDKYENESLIAYGWPEDLWFHVDKLSSAHVYLRLPPDVGFDEVPPALVEECALFQHDDFERLKPSMLQCILMTDMANHAGMMEQRR